VGAAEDAEAEPRGAEAGPEDAEAEPEDAEAEPENVESASADFRRLSPVPVGSGEEPERTDTAEFWESVGIDPILISMTDEAHYTLRCYLDDKPVFLGSGGRIDVFDSERALARWLADGGKDDNDLVAASTWQEVLDRAAVGELEVVVDELNDYVLVGIDEDIAEGTLEVDPTQLELATELVLDVAEWAGDPEPARALAESESLGWLVSFVIRPNPTRLAPSPPFDSEAARWRELVHATEARLHRR
jgi:hypothetical protein